jgi:hypothetical protein
MHIRRGIKSNKNEVQQNSTYPDAGYPDIYIYEPLYRVLVGKPEGKRPLGRPRHRWERNIKMDL